MKKDTRKKGILNVYFSMLVNMVGAKKVLNPLDQVDWLSIDGKDIPCALYAPEPDWTKIPTRTMASKKDDVELAKDIRAIARKLFTKNQNKDEAYLNLKKEFISKVSPDRIKIYEENKRNLAGNMNAALSYFTEEDELVLAYYPNGRWILFTTEEERARNQLFNDIFNREIDRIQVQLGKKGIVI